MMARILAVHPHLSGANKTHPRPCFPQKYENRLNETNPHLVCLQDTFYLYWYSEGQDGCHEVGQGRIFIPPFAAF